MNALKIGLDAEGKTEELSNVMKNMIFSIGALRAAGPRTRQRPNQQLVSAFADERYRSGH